MILANDHNILATPIWKEVMNWAKEDKITLITLLSRSLSESTANDNGKEKTFTFEENDVIIKVGDIEVSGTSSLISILSEYKAGDEVELTVYRIKRQSVGFGTRTYTEEYQVKVKLTEYKG